MAIHRAGTELVNWYLLEEGGKVTIVDAGLPTYRRQLEGALHEIGRALEDVEAIVLTHAHIDHVGFSQLLQDERGTPVYAHVDELAQAQTGKPPKTEGSWVSAVLRHRTARKVIFHIARNGGARPPRVATVTAFGDGEALDVPGHPRAVRMEHGYRRAGADPAATRVQQLDGPRARVARPDRDARRAHAVLRTRRSVERRRGRGGGRGPRARRAVVRVAARRRAGGQMWQSRTRSVSRAEEASDG
jgi:CRP-like cAMP-binding protein